MPVLLWDLNEKWTRICDQIGDQSVFGLMSNALFGCFDQNFTKSVNKGSVFHNCSFITRNQNDNNVSKSQKQ